MTIRTAIKPDNPSRAEREFFRIASALGDDWSVWMNRELSFETNNGSVFREVDAILYHKIYGLLLVECKSGIISTRINTETNITEWLQSGKVLNKPPHKQMFSLISPLHDYIKILLSKHEPRVRVQWAVCFADMSDMQGIPQSEIPRSRAILKGDTLNLKTFEKRLISILETREASHNNQAYPNDFLDEESLFALTNFLDGNGEKPNEADLINYDSGFQEQATEMQQMLMESISRNLRVRIEGIAGSGKSRMAIWEALRLSRLGKNVAIACYNDLLAADLEKTINNILAKDSKIIKNKYGKDGGVSFGRIDVNAYSVWCEKYAKAAKILPKKGTDQNEYYENTLPHAFARAKKMLRNNKKTREKLFYDAVIIDEAQDFTSEWIDSIIELLQHAERGVVRIFYDPAQRLYGLRNGIENKQVTNMPVLVLSKGLRNTKKILEWVRKNTGISLQCYANTVSGTSVKEIRYETETDLATQLIARTNELMQKYNLNASDIIVVSMHSKKSSSLKNFKNDLFAWNDTGTKRLIKDKVNIVSVHRIKGLDANAAILFDIEKPENISKREEWKRRLLVAATRAKKLLTVMRKK